MSCEKELVEIKKINEQLVKQNSVLEQKLIEFYSLYYVLKEISKSKEIDDLFETTNVTLRDVLKVDSIIVYLLDDITSSYILHTISGFDPEKIDRIRVDDSDPFILKFIEESKMVITKADQFDIPIFGDTFKVEGALTIVPLWDKNLIGFMILLRKDRGFEYNELDIFATLGEHLSVELSKVKNQEKIRDMIHIDPETGLYNRRFFYESIDREIERSRRYRRPLSVMLVRIEGVTDYLAQEGKDKTTNLIKQIADDLTNKLRRSDIITRNGTDELNLILPETSKKDAFVTGGKVLNILNEVSEKMLKNNTIKLITSVGFSTFPDDARDPLKLVNLADEALFNAQKDGGNKIYSA